LSKIGDFYCGLYNRVCGVHPKLYPWHFQWLAVKYLYADLARVLPGFHGNVLDVGCGDKPYKLWLSEDVSHIGIDICEGSFVDPKSCKWHFQHLLPESTLLKCRRIIGRIGSYSSVFAV